MHFQSEYESMTYILTSELMPVNNNSISSSTQAYDWCMFTFRFAWSFLSFQIEEAVEGEATHVQNVGFETEIW